MEQDKLRYGKYQHYRTKELYEIIGLARHSETKEEMIIYKALYYCETFGDHPTWVRPKTMFFEHVEHLGHSVPRFRWVSE